MMLSLCGGRITFSTFAISIMESLTETAASANLIVASSLGLLTGGFLKVPAQLTSRAEVINIRTIFLLIQCSLNCLERLFSIETGGGLLVKIFLIYNFSINP